MSGLFEFRKVADGVHVAVASVNFLGEGLREVLDPRLR